MPDSIMILQSKLAEAEAACTRLAMERGQAEARAEQAEAQLAEVRDQLDDVAFLRDYGLRKCGHCGAWMRWVLSWDGKRIDSHAVCLKCFDKAREDRDRYKAELATICKSFSEVCAELGCTEDNEAALMAVVNLKAEIATYRERDEFYDVIYGNDPSYSQLQDELARKDKALEQIAKWFQEYADMHTAKGKYDKAERNQERANFAREAMGRE